jgi:hypothetical protein
VTGGSCTILGEVNVEPALMMVVLVKLPFALLDVWSLMRMLVDRVLLSNSCLQKRRVDFMAIHLVSIVRFYVVVENYKVLSAVEFYTDKYASSAPE